VAADPEKFIGTKEVAELLHVDRRTVQRKVWTGEIPIVGNLGDRRGFLFEREAIEELAKQEKPSDPAGTEPQ
jgi:excisionase family DNA binding protein